jgi:type VI protein secretion system component VasK
VNAAPPFLITREPVLGSAPRRVSPYLREHRAQPRRGFSPRVLVLLLALGGLLFLRVWERTQANALSMQRDRLAREVRALSNRIQLSTELADQAALREGLSLATLHARGFTSPDPARVVQIDPRLTAGADAAPRNGLRAALSRVLNRILPERTRGSGSEMPPATQAGVGP